jgi:hypothetical protein
MTEFTRPTPGNPLGFIQSTVKAAPTHYVPTMGWLDSTWSVATAYVVLVLVAIGLGRTERLRRRAVPASTLWPAFWFMTAALLIAMALGRVTDTGQLISDIGRQQARSQGWYNGRRSIQAVVIGGIALVWFSVVLTSIWRVPERRRRYLPTAIGVFTLCCYAGIRVISLHQVDAVLHNRNINGLTVGNAAELVILALTVAAAIVCVFTVRETDKLASGEMSDARI